MTEQERIEGINSEQLATATDRVLLAARFGRARPSSPQLHGAAARFARGSAPALLHARHAQAPGADERACYVPQTDAPVYTPQTPARGSSPEIPVHTRSLPRDEQTLFVRHAPPRPAIWRRFATISLVTSLVSVTTAILLLV